MTDNEFWFLLFGGLTIIAVTAILANAWQKVRRADREAALKEAMLKRDLSVEQMERLLGAGPVAQEEEAEDATDDDAIEELAEALGECGVSAPVLEEVLAAVRSADPSTRQTTCRAVQAVIRGSEEEDKSELVLATVRGLCRPAAPTVVVSPHREAQSASEGSLEAHPALVNDAFKRRL
jgi:hypothetical protein